MPFIELVTNASMPDAGSVAKQLTKVAAEALSKPEAVFFVEARHNNGLCFAGSSDPCAVVRCQAIGGEANDVVVPITEQVTASLGVPKERVFVNFVSFEPTMWGWQGKLISEISKEQQQQ